MPKLSAYPNPSNGNVFIQGSGRVKIYDMKGKLIIMPYVDNTYMWNTNNIPTGIYFLISEYKKIKLTLLK